MTRYIAPVMFLMLSVALYLAYIDPMYIEVQKALVREQELVAYIADAKTAQSKIDDLKAQYSAFPPGADQALRVLIPDSIDPLRLIVDMDAVIGKLGLVMKGPGVMVEPSGEGSPLVKYRVNFSVSAPYSVFRNFLHDLEASLALRDMGSIAFTVGGAGGTEFTGVNAVHTYSLNITTYSLPQ
jgi:hypothetical protein